MAITITEALAEIKTIDKRINKKRGAMAQYIGRQEGVKDPLEKEGGSINYIQTERQSIADLENRIITLRRGIQRANDETQIPIEGVSRSISEWLIWRRDIAPSQKKWLVSLRDGINNLRENAKRQGNAAVSATAIAGTELQPTDFIINVDEAALNKEIEQMENILGQLDGQLSLKNATITIVD